MVPFVENVVFTSMPNAVCATTVGCNKPAFLLTRQLESYDCYAIISLHDGATCRLIISTNHKVGVTSDFHLQAQAFAFVH